VHPKDVIELNCESFAHPKKRILPTNEDCGTSDAIVKPVKKIVKIEK